MVLGFAMSEEGLVSRKQDSRLILGLCWGFFGVIMENQMEKKMENEMDNVILNWSLVFSRDMKELVRRTI